MSKRADLHIELAKVFESQYKQLDLVIKSKLYFLNYLLNVNFFIHYLGSKSNIGWP